MTPERSQAYGRVTKTIEDIGPAKLHDLEGQRIRNAADTLLFAASSMDQHVFDALADVENLTRHLTESERWSGERARRLADDVAACGPSFTVDLPVAEPARAA